MTIKDEICPTVKVDARLLDDGTLWIKTDKIADIGRVIVEDGKTSCKQFYQDAQPEPCEDAVSRKAVKDGFVEMCSLICPYTEKQRHIMCGSCLLGTAFDVLEATQPVTPKQRTGKWIPVDSYTAYGGDEATWMAHGNPVAFYYCSECKEHAYAGEDGDDILSKFCPNCGVKMKGVAE